MRPCYIFTGQSGLHTDRMLAEKIKEFAGARKSAKTVEVGDLDGHMATLLGEIFKEDKDRVRVTSVGGFKYLMRKPKRVLRKLWELSVDRCLSEISETPKNNPVDAILLSMHAIFYHTYSREFFHCVDAQYLKSRLATHQLEVRAVITLIDDLYDIYLRLRERGQLFDPTVREKPRHPFEVWKQGINDLMLLLDWRSNEILSAEQLVLSISEDSETLIPHYLIAVRHPLTVVYDLMFSEKRPAYVSHPITEIRREEDRAEASRDKEHAERARLFKVELEKLTQSLAEGEHVIPLSPTTIDDLIIKKQEVPTNFGPVTVYFPELRDRWDKSSMPDSSELLYIKPTPADASNIYSPVDLYGYFRPRKPEESIGTLGQQPPPTPTPEEQTAASRLLSLLTEWIGMQINSRDRKLVEQSRRLVVFRPYFNGHLATGVKEEVEHRAALISFKLVRPEEYPAFAMSPREDFAQWRINKLIESLQDDLRFLDGNRELSKEQSDALADQLRRASIRQLFDEGKLTPAALRAAVEEVVGAGITFEGLSRDGGTLGPEAGPEYEIKLDEKWAETLNLSMKAEDIVKSYLNPDDDDLYLDKLVPTKVFVEQIVGLLEKTALKEGREPEPQTQKPPSSSLPAQPAS